MLVTARRGNIYLWLEILAAVSLVVMLATSYLAVSRADTSRLIPAAQAAAMLVGTLIPALSLLVLFGRRLAIRRAGGTTARLHVNLVFFFSLVAAIPTLLVAVFASVLFQSSAGVSEFSREMMENANRLAQGYYQQAQDDVRLETTTMVSDMRDWLTQVDVTSADFQNNYAFQAVYRKLSESAILQLGADGQIRTIAILDPAEDSARERISPATLKRLQAEGGGR